MSKVRSLECFIKNIEKLKEDIFRIELDSEYLAKNSLPGQFLHIKVDENLTLLRRPFSIHRVEKGCAIFILFRVRGKGTQILSQKQGQIINVLGPLGGGFVFPKRLKREEVIILAGGGLGIAPLYFLAQKLIERFERNKIICILGFKDKKEVICEEDFESLKVKSYIITEQQGIKKNLPDFLEKFVEGKEGYIYCCGPKEMMKSIKEKKFKDFKVQVSLENFFGCGVGVCGACSILTKKGIKKVCKDGPVFDLEKLIDF